MVLGLITAAIMDHPAPVIMAAIVTAAMVGMYEWALAEAGTEGGEG
jgi:hypothetical protein